MNKLIILLLRNVEPGFWESLLPEGVVATLVSTEDTAMTLVPTVEFESFVSIAGGRWEWR